MLFAPIITLDLVTAARRMRYFIVRVIYALVLLLLLWTNYSGTRMGYGEEASIRQIAAFSAAFFATFAATQLAAILLLTPAMIAGCIAQERERKTIEYLFSSTLTNGEIVLSKYVARTVHVGAILVVGLPVLALTMMLGGIDPELLLMVFLLTLATLIAVAALSIASSVWSKRGRDAVVRCYLLVVGLLALPPIFLGLAMALQGQAPYWITLCVEAVASLTALNPFVVLSKLFQERILGGAGTAWTSVGTLCAAYVGFAAVLLAWSTLSIRRVYRKSVGSGAPKERARWFAGIRRRPQLGARPMIWKEMFAETAAINVGRIGRVILALLFAASVIPPYWMLIAFSNQGPYRGPSYLRLEISAYVSVMTAILMHGALLIIMVRAAGSITAERERDSWLTLISTPLTPAEIVWGKIAGSLYAARWFLLPIGLLWLLNGYVWPEMLLILPVLAVMFTCVALAVATTGLWFSSWCATSIRAIGSAVGVAIFFGGGYLMCCAPVAFTGAGDDSFILCLAFCIPMLLGAPGIMWQENIRNMNRSMSNDDGFFLVAMIVGTVGYFIIGAIMASVTIANFDALTGRPNSMQDPGPRSPQPPRPPSLPPPPAGKDIGPDDLEPLPA